MLVTTYVNIYVHMLIWTDRIRAWTYTDSRSLIPTKIVLQWAAGNTRCATCETLYLKRKRSQAEWYKHDSPLRHPIRCHNNRIPCYHQSWGWVGFRYPTQTPMSARSESITILVILLQALFLIVMGYWEYALCNVWNYGTLFDAMIVEY